ncbi:MAG: DUF5343 domain-containing protein [bacterium]
MSDYAYAMSTGKLKQFIEKIRTLGIPKKASTKWLKEIGYTSSNDTRMLGIIKFINFADANGVPTAFWTDYRGANHAITLAEGIRLGYSDLFQTYVDANNRSDDELKSFFSTNTKAAEGTVQYMVTTFKALCESADFSADYDPEKSAGEQPKKPGAPSEKPKTPPSSKLGDTTININIQLTLPETTNSEVYEKFFAAMRENLLSTK